MPLREDLLKPIAGDNPGGKNLRYDPITDKIKEARREDVDLAQGAWQHALKVADHAAVIKLAGDAIATRSKDLQLAVWLVEAHVRREGFAVLAPCLEFLRNLIEEFWDTLYPEIEDGDVEMRAAPLDWLGTKFEPNIRSLPITSDGMSWFKYKESRAVGSEADAAGNYEKTNLRNQQIAEGKVPAETFDAAVEQTPKAFYEKLQDQLTASLAALESLNECCDARFGEFAPSLVKLRTALEEIGGLVRIFINRKGGPTQAAPAPAPVSAPEPAPVQAPPPAPAYSAPVYAPAAPAAAPPIAATGGDAPASLDDAARRLGAIARFLRQRDVYDISPYLILRGFRWGEIRYNGPSIDTSMLAGPPPELRSQLAASIAERKWERVIETTETAMELPCGRAWLDVQRHAVRALLNMGPAFQFVADAIRTNLRGLLEELPFLVNLSLTDGSPAADQETKDWIAREVVKAAAETPASAEAYTPPEPAPVAAAPEPEPEPAPAPPPPPPPLALTASAPLIEEDKPVETTGDEAFDAAIAAARAGDHTEAVRTLRKALASEQTGRGRFRRRAQLAHILIAGGREHVAHPILEELAAEIDSRKLEGWEAGDALAYPLSLLLRCLATNGQDPEVKRQVYARICRLDPVQALACPD